jgi:glycosyltransferase involved in cell wall biosynthesis
MSTGTLLILSQVYPPDPASVGQHMHDAAAELAKRGRRVRVITSRRGYDDASRVYAKRENRDGVDVVRVSLSSFGKKSLPLRALAMALFMLQCTWHGLTARRLECIMVSTSPPMCSFAAVIAAAIRRVPIKFWVMDLNPDQAVQMGLLKPTSPIARVFNWFNRVILRRAADVVALDRFMAERLNRKVDVTPKMHVMPPWPHDEHLDTVPHDQNPFRKAHGLDGKFVFMYSGNHGLTTPVTTILQAALKLRQRDDLAFMFIGGGHGKKEVEAVIQEHNPPNIRSLPYQPIDQLRYSLSAADVHLVTMGDQVVGVIHPCKIYGAMRIARPILLVGPDPCHATDLIAEARCGWRIANGDVDGAIRTIEQIAATPAAELAEMGRRGARLVDQKYSMSILCNAYCDVVERGLPATPAAIPAAPTEHAARAGV